MPRIRHSPVAPTQSLMLHAGGAIDAHRHDDHQVVYAARGVVAVQTEAGTWVTPGTRAIWVPAGTVHAHRAYGDVELRMIGLPAAVNPLALQTPTVLRVDPLLRELILEYTRSPGADGPQRRRLRAVLLDRLSSSTTQPLHLPMPQTPLLRQLCALLEADPARHATLAELGRELGASDRSLSRLFRADVGMTFVQWRTQLRLRHAMILLAQNESVTGVAHACGWSSPSAFIDVFRRVVGETPSAHRLRVLGTDFPEPDAAPTVGT